MMGIAAGIGGFAQGVGQGLKLRSDLEDAEARRGLMKTQKEAADLQLNDMKLESAYKKDVNAAVSSAFQDTTPVPTTDDAYGGRETLGAPAPAAAGPAGIAVPGQSNPGLSDFEKTAKAMEAVKRIDMKYGKVKPLEALKQAKEFSALQNEGVTDAFKYFAATGDQAGTLERFNATGSFKAPEGTTIETRMREMIPGNKDTARPDYVAKLPGGREISFMELTRNSLNPKDLMSLETETGMGVAKLALMKTAEENAAERHKQMFELTNKKYDMMIEQHRAQTNMALERLNLAKDEARYQKVQGAFTGAFSELTNTLGVNKKFDPALASESDKKEHGMKLLAASSAQSIFEMNYDLKKNGAGVTPQQALNVWKSAAANPGSVKFDEETGMHYIEVGKKPVFVPSTLAPRETPTSGPGAAPQPAPAGIKLPSGPNMPNVPGRPLYNANQSDLLRIATKPRGISSAEAADAQAEIDARKGESRMSGR